MLSHEHQKPTEFQCSTLGHPEMSY